GQRDQPPSQRLSRADRCHVRDSTGKGQAGLKPLPELTSNFNWPQSAAAEASSQAKFAAQIAEHNMIAPADFSAEALLAELLDWVRIESPTYDAAAVNRMQDFIAQRLAKLGFTVQRLPGRDGFGDLLHCHRPAAVEAAGLLLIAHADTVHPVGTLQGQLSIRRQADKCFGPAIYDMKGGTVMALAALAAVIEAK